jgi:hypothetical protein
VKRLALYGLAVVCGGSADDTAGKTLTVTAPIGEAELVPGGTVDVTWTLSDAAQLSIDAVALSSTTGPTLFDQQVPAGAGDFPFAGVDATAQPLPPGVYDLAFSVDGVASDATASVLVNGITVTAPAPGTTATATGTYSFDYTSATLRPLEVTISLGNIVVSDATINGELVPHDHLVSFTGTDTTGTAVPAGSYAVTITATDPSSALTYTVDGGTLDFTP